MHQESKIIQPGATLAGLTILGISRQDTQTCRAAAYMGYHEVKGGPFRKQYETSFCTDQSWPGSKMFRFQCLPSLGIILTKYPPFGKKYTD